MRFRPLGNSGVVVSVISLALAESNRNRPQDWEALVYCALEHGINSFEVTGRHPAIAEGLSMAVHAIERRLACVTWRLGNSYDAEGRPMRDFSADALEHAVMSILARTGFSYLDAVVLDEPRARELDIDALNRLKALRAAGRVRLLGVAGQDEAIDAYISTGVFDLLHMPYSILSGWKERLRQQAAADHNMAVTSYDYYPDRLRRGQGGLPVKGAAGKAAHPLAGVGTYAFLDSTPGWTGEGIALSHAMTNPALASLQIVTDRPERIAALTAVVERDLPSGVPAQIEMARFAQAAADRGGRRA